ncbi:estradiol 17-beta-dehydrogenase 8 isoform X2 [Orussus abietinus]|uniref:estradiol 17-beta-dehydrogenase 8 isoform X2 n=1 Tax=Orussus abietinus TaxID=222816 RepID=UPI0006263391|nr:estradiol 17-beta-dehydrogenase 8 isoform X2 [Orussus abietinus]
MRKGAGSGIGKATCQALARQGAKVVAADQNLKTAKQTVDDLEGSGHLPVEVDVSSTESVSNAFKKTTEQFRRPPTIVVNSAGITRDNFLLKLNSTEFDDVISVNLKGTFLVIQSAVKAMIEAGTSEGASIINIASIVGKTGNLGQCNYSASKAGVESLTKTAAMEFGKFGIRVNSILPGIIQTPMIQTVPDNVKKMFISRIPLNRLGNPEEVAEAILFLASNKSSYINAASIEVTGGMH